MLYFQRAGKTCTLEDRFLAIFKKVEFQQVLQVWHHHSENHSRALCNQV